MQIICTFSRSIHTTDLGKPHLIQCMGKQILNHWCESSWKMAYYLRTCISIMNKVKINEQNKSIATGPLYLHSDFEAI